MLQAYQHLPENINPIVLTIGSFSIRWYAVMYLAAFGAVYLLLRYRIKRGEMDLSLVPLSAVKTIQLIKSDSEQVKITRSKPENNAAKIKNQLHFASDMIFYSVLGVIIGGRLGYVLFYNLSYFMIHPLAIISPVDLSMGIFTGIYGMSYFGGLIGVIISLAILIRKKDISFWALSDFIVPAIPAGYFFGRIGNFINGELYGRTTEKPWGMYFSADSSGSLRHPSQLYEAFFEGIVLFMVLWLFRNNKKFTACHWPLPVYLFGYGFFRFWIEFFREPDSQIGLISWLTLGQILSLVLMVAAIGIIFWRKGKIMI